MKNKQGRRTSHSYCSRTHGPRKTTHETSGEHPWWRGDSRRSILPPAGCREEVFWCSRSRKRGDGGTEARSRKRVLFSEVSRDGEYIGERGQPEVDQGPQEPPWRGQGWGRAGWPPGPPWLPSGPTWTLLEASSMLIFYLNFPEFFWHFLYGGKLK